MLPVVIISSFNGDRVPTRFYAVENAVVVIVGLEFYEPTWTVQ